MIIAICDDNRMDLEILKQYCKQYNPDYEVSLFDNGADLLEVFQEKILISYF